MGRYTRWQRRRPRDDRTSGLIGRGRLATPAACRGSLDRGVRRRPSGRPPRRRGINDAHLLLSLAFLPLFLALAPGQGHALAGSWQAVVIWTRSSLSLSLSLSLVPADATTELRHCQMTTVNGLGPRRGGAVLPGYAAALLLADKKRRLAEASWVARVASEITFFCSCLQPDAV